VNWDQYTLHIYKETENAFRFKMMGGKK